MTVLLIKKPYPFQTEYLRNPASVSVRLGYLAAILRNNNVPYEILDLNIDSIEEFGIKKHNLNLKLLSTESQVDYLTNSIYHKKRKRYLKWINKKIKNKIKNIEFVCINTDATDISLNILRILKGEDPLIKTIIGGRKATDNPYMFLQYKFIDYIIRGFVDKSLPELIKKRGNTINSNIIHNNQYKTIITKCSFNIEKILTPDYSKIELKKYFKYFSHIGIINSIGCSSKCLFCNYHGGRYYFKRDNYKIIDEVRWFIDNYNIKNFIFLDSAINNSVKELDSLCNKIIKNGLDLRWQSMFKAENLDNKIIDKIKRSGCLLASFGLESSKKKLLRVVGKKTDIKDTIRIINKFRSKEILTRGSFIYDLPNETLKDFFSSIRFAGKIKLDYYEFHKLKIQYKTHFFNRSDKLFGGLLRKDRVVERNRDLKDILSLAVKKNIAEYLNRAYFRKYCKNKLVKGFFYKQKFLV